MKILLFLPSSYLALDILSLATFLKTKGYQIVFLSSSGQGKMHQACQQNKIENHSLNIKKLNSITYLIATTKLSHFVKKNAIDVVISNNLQGNFIAILAQKTHKKRTLLTRHHSDYIFNGMNKNAKLQQNFVNHFGKEFIAISDNVKQQMLLEGINENKIHRIDLGFDFSLFPEPNQKIVNQLRENFPSSFKMCVIARLIPLKRHILLFEAIRNLVDKGEDVILWVIGDGPLKKRLIEWVRFYRMEKHILFTGYIDNTQDYLSASDLLIHISESEASSHVIREAALYETPVLVCENVGDFGNYIIDNKSGYFVNKNTKSFELSEKIKHLILDKENISKTAVSLKKEVLKRFSIEKNGEVLLNLLNNEPSLL